MSFASLIHSRPLSTSSKRLCREFPLLLVGWMVLTSFCGAIVMGLVMDGILRTVLDSKEDELLASRHLALSTAYRDAGLPGVEKLLRSNSFQHEYIRLSQPSGQMILEQNPDHVRFNHPLLPRPAIGGNSSVPDWAETITDRGLDYDLLTGRLPGGATLCLGLNEQPQEKFFRRSEKVAVQIGGSFLVLGILGAAILLFRFREPTS
ncbi:MAG: hypothetical protein ABIT76_05710 [Chthoniobacterales bacterium]